MKWRIESWSTKNARLERCHRWFAWHPVRIGDEIYWLEYVWRQRQWNTFDYDYKYGTEYVEGLL